MGSTPLEEDEKRRSCAFVMMGVSEVFLNIIVAEWEKATAVQKVDFENEFHKFVQIHGFFEKHTCTSRQSAGTGRGALRSTASEISDKLESSSSKLYQERIPLLATSSVYWLLRIAPEMRKSDCSTDRAASQNHSQLSSVNAMEARSKLISFALNACLRQLMSLQYVGRDDPLKMLIYGEIKSLGPPLLKLVWWLKSRPNPQTDQKKKETKGRKGVDNPKEHIHLTLICLKKLMSLSFSSSEFSSLIDDLVSVPEIEHGSRDVLTDGCDNESDIADREENQNTRSKVFFIKIMKRLLLELLKLSLFGEVEVEESHCTFQFSAYLFLFLCLILPI